MIFKIFKKCLQFLLIFALSMAWFFSGWPQILNFPPQIPRVHAATLSYVGGASATGNSANFNVSLTGLTGGSGSTAQAGDLVIVVDGFVSTSNGNPGVSTAGYVELSDLYASDSDDANLSVNWKIMGGTPDTSVTCLGSTSASWGATCVVQVWRGVDPITPLDVTTTTATPSNNVGTSVPNAPSITPITIGSIVVAVGVGADAAADTAVTAPSGYSNQVHASVDPSLAVRTSIASKAWSGSGAEDPAVWTGVTTTSAGSWVAATLALRPASAYNQSAYRFFNNADSTDVGSVLAAQDTAATLGSAGAAFRLRLLIHQTDGRTDISGQGFKLQFATKSGTCDTGFTGETYADVTDVTAIAYSIANTPADGDNLTANANDPTHSGHTIVNQDYDEANNFTNTVAAIPAGQDGKWDFSLIDNSAPASTSYCFRIRKSDDSNLEAYTVIPEITTASFTPVYSVSITSSGVVAYGFVQIGNATSTVGNGYTQTAQNDGNTTEKLNIKSSDATGGTTWTLASTIGNNQFKHEFSTTTGSTWTTMSTVDTYVTATPSVSQGGTVNFDFRLTAPSTSSDYQQKSITITIQAVVP